MKDRDDVYVTQILQESPETETGSLNPAETEIPEELEQTGNNFKIRLEDRDSEGSVSIHPSTENFNSSRGDFMLFFVFYDRKVNLLSFSLKMGK